ncbi:MAG: TonB family protein [Nannocystaceae bacterium]
MRPNKDKVPLSGALAILLLALLLHVLMALAVEGVWVLGRRDVPPPSTDRMMEVALVPEEEAAALKKDREDPGQVVKNDRIVRERPPKDSEKSSEFDNEVDRETVAPVRREQAAGSGRSGRSSDDAQRHADPSTDPSSAGATEGVSPRPQQGQASDDTPLFRDESGELPLSPGAKPHGSRPGLAGSRTDLRNTFGQRRRLESIEEVDEGAETILNTRRNRFASFFNRVRDAVAQNWHPAAIHTARDPHGNVYGNKTRVTRLRIVLAPDGTVRGITIDRPAGVGYLDEEAIRAVRAAQPFTHPPAQLVDPETGLIDFSFSFILLVDGSRRIFRYRH